MGYDHAEWIKRYVKQGTVAAGDTVYMLDDRGSFRTPSKMKVVRTTKTLVVAKYDRDNEQHHKEYTFRWKDSADRYGCTERYVDAHLITVAAGEADLAEDARVKQVRSLQHAADRLATEFSRETRWTTAAKIRGLCAELEAIAVQLAAVQGDQA